MSTRKDIQTFFRLPLDFSMLELEPETGADPVRYFCTPENAEIIGWGSSGTHFALLPGDEAVYCVEPELAGEGTFVLPVGADFREFLSHVLYCKGTSPLAQIFMMDEARFRKLLADNAANTWPGCEEDFKRRDVSLAAVAETFGIQPRDPFQRVKALQTIFDPSVLVFSDEYYDTLGLDNPRHPEEQELNTGRDVAVTTIFYTDHQEDTP